MKKWQAILGTMVALVMTASVPLSSLAQNEAAATAKPALNGSLAIVAPRSVPVGKEMSLGVFQRETQNPVPGAGVWALTREKAEEVKKAASAQTAADDVDYEALLGSHGSFLGRTGGDGRLVHTCRYPRAKPVALYRSSFACPESWCPCHLTYSVIDFSSNPTVEAK